MRVVGCTLWVAGLWSLAIVAAEHSHALSIGTSLRKFRNMQRTVMQQLVFTGAALYLVAEAATQFYLPVVPMRALHGVATVAIIGTTLFAYRAVAEVAADPTQGQATHKLARVRPIGLPVAIAGLLLELWPFFSSAR